MRHRTKNNDSHWVPRFFLLTMLGTKTRRRNRQINSLELELNRDLGKKLGNCTLLHKLTAWN